jgi:hypothetical protein
MRHRSLTAILAALTATFVLASSALAGGWANAILDDPGDGGTPGAGEPITIGFTLLQHGVTPVDFGTPSVTIMNADSGESRTFEARQRGASGHWVARVTYPSNGTWQMTVTHPDLEVAMSGFRPVTIGPAPAAPAAQPAQSAAASSGNLLQPIALAAFVLLILVAIGLVGVTLFRRRTAPRRVNA